MIWIKKTSLVLISMLFALGLANILASLYIDHRLSRTAKNTVAAISNDALEKNFKKEYECKLDHLRGNKAEENKSVTGFLFDEISHGNQDIVLLQGDSWAENASKYYYREIEEHAQENGYDIILAGVSSYSPTPLTIQLRILEEDFGIKPTLLIAILDQTDIGDELYRYPNPIEYEKKLISTQSTEECQRRIQKRLSIKKERLNNFQSDTFSLIKLYRHIIIKYHQKAEIEAIEISGKKILSGINNKLDNQQTERVISGIKKYLEASEQTKSLKKIILVTHPHRCHNENIRNPKHSCENSIESFVDKAIRISNLSKPVVHYHIPIKDNLFDQNDPFSHLTKEGYTSYYYPKILGILTDEIIRK